MLLLRVECCWFLFLSSLCLISALEYEDSSLENETMDPNEETNPLYSDDSIVPREYFTSWQAKRIIRKLLKQMPCGWPQYGIPPLAPYKNDNLTIDINQDLFCAFTNFEALQIDGLNNVDIYNLRINLLPRKAYFDFNFPNITSTGTFKLKWLFHLLQNLGINAALNGTGDVNFLLHHLRINGSVRYKMPLLFGTANIYQLQFDMSLGDVESHLKGRINRIPITQVMNQQIEKYVLKIFNEYDRYVSPLMAKVLEVEINKLLESKTLWKLIWGASTSSYAAGELDSW